MQGCHSSLAVRITLHVVNIDVWTVSQTNQHPSLSECVIWPGSLGSIWGTTVQIVLGFDSLMHIAGSCPAQEDHDKHSSEATMATCSTIHRSIFKVSHGYDRMNTLKNIFWWPWPEQLSPTDVSIILVRMFEWFGFALSLMLTLNDSVA